jgi:hypothetical protein
MSSPTLKPNSEAGEHVRLGRGWPRLGASVLRTTPKQKLESFLCARVFREGAENRARGGRAPILISEFGLNHTPAYNPQHKGRSPERLRP